MSNQCGTVPFGRQNDGAGTHYCAVANTEWGQVPGKAKGDTCWYPYGGKEYYTTDFSYLECKNTAIELVQNKGAPPEGALFAGKQSDDSGDHFAAIANTEWGTIPGKAKGNRCWYSYDEKEYYTEDFMWVSTVRNNVSKDTSDGSNNQCGAAPFGCQNDGAGTHYCAVANTEWGQVAGKAKGDTCWYPYGGKEYYTTDFSYLESKNTATELVQNAGAPPEGALCAGQQSDGEGEHFAAIANTEWGMIPGKAKGNRCWYSYDKKEHYTEDFMWVTTV